MSENLKLPTQKIEPLILNNCIQNPAFFLKYKKYLQTLGNKSYFNDEKYQKIFNVLAKYYDKFQKLPTKETVEIIAEKLNKDPEIKAYSERIRFGAMISNFVETTNMRFTAVYPEKESKTCPALVERIKEGDSNPDTFIARGSIVIPFNTEYFCEFSSIRTGHHAHRKGYEIKYTLHWFP